MMERRGVPQNVLAMVKVNLHGDGKPPRREQVTWPTLVSRGGLSYLRRCARMQHSYVREQLSKGASVAVNLLGELSGRAVEQRKERRRRRPARLLTARRTRAKQPDEASSCFALPPRADAWPRVKERREGGGRLAASRRNRRSRLLPVHCS